MLTRTGRRRFPILPAVIVALLVFIAVDAASSPVQAQTPSADASLSSLSLSDITLSPTFSAEVTSYDADAELASTVTSTTVTAETTDEDATAVIKINGVEDTDGTVDLVAGYNVIAVVVTAQDGTTTRTYTVTVLRAQPDDDDDSTNSTITSLLARMDARVIDDVAANNYRSHTAGYNSGLIGGLLGSLSPAGFNYPAGFGLWYTVETLTVLSTGQPNDFGAETGTLRVRGPVTSVTSDQDSDDYPHRVLPVDADITLHLETDDFTRSLSLDDFTNIAPQNCVDDNDRHRDCRIGEIRMEEYTWDGDDFTLPPLLAHGDKVIVRLRYSAPRPGTPGRPSVTAPTGKSGALVVNWIAPANDDPEVRGYEVHVSPAPGETEASGVTRTTGGSTTRLPVLLLEPDTAYDVRVRARTYFASGPWSDTVSATTNSLVNSGTNNPSVTLDLDDVTKVKVGDKLHKRLKVTGMNNLHAEAFPARFEGYNQSTFVEFRVLDGISDSYEYEDLTRGYGEGAFYAGALTIGEDGEVYHNFGYEVIATGPINEDGAPEYGPLYLWLERTTTGKVQIGGTANSRATALCVEIADDSNNVPSGRGCPSPGGSAGHAVQRITARFNDVPQSHDGESEFTVRLAFVKDVGISPTSLREDALAVTGGAVTQVQRVDDRSDLFEITVEPDSDEDVTITLSSSGDCGEAGSICTQGEDPKKLYNSPTATVAGPILTASFEGLPSQHDGATAFSFRIAFSDEIATDEADFRDHSVEVWGGEVTRAEPVGQRRDLWEVEVGPASEDSVMVSLKLTQSCAATGAVCTAGGRLLSVIPATMVPGPATWPVRVTGVAQVGKTLTADSSNLSERYGVQVTSMTYRWLANGARVPGANARTYKPGDDQQGQTISVMATYTDDRGSEDTVISAPTEPLAARDRIRRATGLPLISGRALVGHTLTADKSLIIDANGLENAVFHYFWEADDESIPGATGTTYTPVAADVGKVITVIVAYVDDAGRGQNMTSPATLPVITEDAAAAAEFRNSLRVAANADGSLTLYWNAPDDDVTGYRILRHRHSLGEHEMLVYVADTGSTATTYTDTGVVAGAPHTYRVQAIRNGALGERTNQLKIFPVQKATNRPATGAPAISGTAQVGETLTADISGIADADGLENVTKDYLWAAIGSSGKIGAKYAYQWLADGAESDSGQHHAGYNNTTYTLTEDDVGKAISVRVTFVDDAGYQETLTSAATDPVAAATPPNSPATGAPTIGGTAQVGETLTADTSGITDEDGLDDSTFTVQWVREDSVMVANAAGSYTPTDGDRGKSVKVRVSFTDDAGNPETRTSTQTSTVEARTNSPAAGLPTISGTAVVGETLTADVTGISDSDGVDFAAFAYQWVSSDGTTDTDIEDATGSTYKLVAADEGKAIKVRVTFTDGGGNEETLTSAPTEPVLGDGPPGAPRNLTATAGDKEVSLSWEPPADNGNAPATGYRIEWRVDGKDYDKNIDKNIWGTAGSTTYTTNDQANLANGVKYFFRVKAGNGSGNSQGSYGPASGEVSATPTSGSAVDLGTPVLSNTENLHHGMVRLDWEDIEDAGWYVVQYYHVKGREWLDLPAEGVDIALHGSSAVVSNLHGLSWLRVRAMSCAGESEWSQIEQSFGTNASDWERVPVPEVEEGDEIEPCPVVLGTPVLSDTETLHHGMVQLDWEDIEDAGWYVVQYYHVKGREWLDLPAEGVDVALHGSSAVVSGVDGLSWLRVRALSCAGESEWSQIEPLFLGNASGWEGVPVPEVEEGDEIEPCSEDADTPDNSPATGAPTIGGTAQVGQTLTANTSGIADADGLTNVSFTYQWLADDTDIAGASGSTYTLTDSEESKAIKVEVSFTDDAGNDETLTTAATDAVAAASTPNSPATGAPTISGTIQVGETLTADTSGVSDADGLSSVQYEYQWLADDSDISGATNATYTLVAADEGKVIKVRVSFTDDADNEETLTSAATDAVDARPNSDLSAPPVVDGPNNVNYVENATSPVARYSTDDPEEDAITWGVSGRDGPAFSIDDGVLKFRTPPNYERPADNDADNEYQVDVVATDSSQAGTTIAVTIKVTDVRDPNIVLIMADDVGYEAFGSYGSTQYRTPRLDELASAGVRFTHAYSKPVCTPSRVALMTGKSNIQNYADFGVLLPGQYTFADLFREAGYTTAITGKWQLHGGKYSRLTGVEADEAGFDTYCLWNTDNTGENRYWNPSIECDGQVIEWGQDAYGPDIFTDFLLEFIESNQDGPFFAYYPMVLPHSPFVPPPDAQCPATDDEQCNFEDMVSRLDHNVGRIHDKLAALELLDNTILVFTSDNGTHRSLVSYLDGVEIHGDKNLPTDGGTRVPLIAVVPGGEGGRVIDDLIDFTDFLPTLADAAALTIPEDVALDGVSFWERLQGRAGHPREWIYTYYFSSPYAYTHNSPAQHPEVAYARDKRYKLYSTGELFDLSEDRYEIHPLPSDHEDSLEARTRLQVALYSMPAAGQEIRWSFVNDGATSGKRPLWRPVLKAATVRGNELTLTYAGILRTKVKPPADAFEVQVDGTGRTVSAVSITASAVTLALASPVTVGQTVTVSYTPGTNALQHVNRSSGNTASALANRAVKNETPPNSPATGAPTITGTAQVGQTLTADTSGIADADGLASATFSYQWLADDAEIAGATGSTYTLSDAEESKAIKVQVSFTDDAYNEEAPTSAATDVVAGAQPTEPPAKPRGLEATATHDSVTLTWDDPGNDSITGYVILRRIPGVDPQGQFDELVADTGTDATTYTDNEVAAETRYTYRIKAINGAGTSERSRWYHIDTPEAPVPDKPRGLEATATHGQVTLTWDDPGDDSITGYVILRRVRENDTGGDFSVLVADTGSAATTHTDATVAAGTTYTYRIKAINEHGTSERSSWYHIDIPEAGTVRNFV